MRKVLRYVVLVCVAFAVDAEPPSPKSHDQSVGAPVDVSVKATLNGAVPFVGVAVKLAVGGVGCDAVAVMVFATLSEPVAFATVSRTV